MKTKGDGFSWILRYVGFATIAGGIVTLVLIMVLNPPSMGTKVIEEFSKTFVSCSLRVRVYKELGAFPVLPGCYYVFEVRLKEEERWRRIMVFRHDDHIPIPKGQIRTIGKVIYFFIGWMFAVSLDGGRSWHVKNMLEELAKLGYDEQQNYKLIKNVVISSSGTGKMILSPIRRVPDVLVTRDFGISWRVQE